jgi:hypothetical protein
MTSTSQFDGNTNEKTLDEAPPGLITKESDHPFSAVLLGEVVAIHWLGDACVLYYADNHKAFFKVDQDGDLVIGDYEVPMC